MANTVNGLPKPYDYGVMRPTARPTALAMNGLVDAGKDPKTDEIKDKGGKVPTTATPTGASATATGPVSNNYLDKYFSILRAEQQAKDDQIASAYKQAIGLADQQYENSRNQINRNYYNSQRYMNQLYGGGTSGVGLSNQARLAQSRDANLASIEQARMNAYSNADLNRANALNTAYNNYGNNVANMARYGLTYNGDIDDTSYLKYLQALGLGR